MKRAVLILLRIVIAAGCVLLVLGGVLTFFPQLSILAAFSAPKSPYCTIWKAVGDAKIKLTQAELAKEYQQGSRLIESDGRYERWQTPKGAYWVPKDGVDTLFVLLAQQARGIYSHEQVKIRKGDVVIDCGAHVGTYVRTALDEGASKVIAVEPSPDVVECLRRNFREEAAAGRVVVVAKGVWDFDGVLTLYNNGPGGAGDSFINHGGGQTYESIPVTTIDHIAESLALQSVDFIKADVKGATERMIKASASVIRKWKPRLAISTETPPEDPAGIARLLQSLDSRYKEIGGPCFYTEGEIRTDVLFIQ